jgi:hypothetical protein
MVSSKPGFFQFPAANFDTKLNAASLLETTNRWWPNGCSGQQLKMTYGHGSNSAPVFAERQPFLPSESAETRVHRIHFALSLVNSTRYDKRLPSFDDRNA